MPSSTLDLYNTSTAHSVFYLAQTGAGGTVWSLSGRTLSEPCSVSLQKKIAPAGSSANDHVIVRVAEIARNTTTAKLATGSVTMDISVPKDTSIIGNTAMTNLIKWLSGIIQGGVVSDTVTNVTALLEGRDL